MKVGKTILRYLLKVHGIPRSFCWSKTFSFYKIYLILSRKWMKSFASHQYRRYLIKTETFQK